MTGQTGLRKNRKAEHSALECTTRQSPSLRASLLDLPPLCIPADEFNTAGTEVNVGCPEIIVATNPEYTNTQQDLPDQWV